VTAELAVLTSRLRGDDKRILVALERRGLPVCHVDPRRLALASTSVTPWSLVLNREISASRARHAAHTLEAAGATVLNCAAATDVCADKWLTTLALRRDGVPTPRTTLALTPEAALDELDRFGYPAVVKPLTGSWGRQVSLLREPDAARAVLEHRAALPNPEAHLIYLQEYVEKPGRDIRVVVLGGRAVAAAYRVSADWRCNVALGAQTVACPIGPELAKVAIAAAGAVGAELAGVDLVEGDGGELLVLEVNHNVELAGAQQAAGDSVDLAGSIAALVADRYEGGAR
jgi:[lysine-biosynthesis-protein LysW]--L-2-aminoadipate ligase